MRVVIPTIGATGHFHPLVPLARALEQAGHEVGFACPYRTFGHIIEANGFRVFPAGFEWRNVDGTIWHFQEIQRLRQQSGRELAGPEISAWVTRNLFAGRFAESMITDLLALHENSPFDLVVHDSTDFAGPLVAEAVGVPHATAGFADFRSREFFQSTGADLIARYRSQLGLDPDPSLESLWRYLVLAPTAPSLVAQEDFVAPVTHFIRPDLFDQSGDEVLPGWAEVLGDRPVIYATLGTAASRFPVAQDIFRAIIDASQDDLVDLVLTVGRGHDTGQFGVPPANVHVAEYIPQTLLLPHCDVVITHGGFNTTIAALSHGLPLVVIPIAADQFENAVRVERAGAGDSDRTGAARHGGH